MLLSRLVLPVLYRENVQIQRVYSTVITFTTLSTTFLFFLGGVSESAISPPRYAAHRGHLKGFFELYLYLNSQLGLTHFPICNENNINVRVETNFPIVKLYCQGKVKLYNDAKS